MKLKELGAINAFFINNKNCIYFVAFCKFPDGMYLTYHNSDGPAVIGEDGHVSYWLNGERQWKRADL